MEILLGVVVAFVAAWALLRWLRYRALMEKYGDPVLVGKLMRKMIWEGQTQGQLQDSIGRPVEVDQKVMKSKIREIWKYNQTSRKRFGLRVTVEDGTVVGWDQKA